MSEFVALSRKVYAYKEIQVDGTLSEDKKARGTSKLVTKKTLSFDHYKKCLFNNDIVKCIQYRIKSTPSSVDTMQINKIALKISDNKRLRSFDAVRTAFLSSTKGDKVITHKHKMRNMFLVGPGLDS